MVCRCLKPSCCVCVCRKAQARQRSQDSFVTSHALHGDPKVGGSSPANHLLGSRAQPAALDASMQQGHLCAAAPPAAVPRPAGANGAHCRRCSRLSDGCSGSSSCGCTTFAELAHQVRNARTSSKPGAVRRIEGRSLRPRNLLGALQLQMSCSCESRANGNGPYV